VLIGGVSPSVAGVCVGLLLLLLLLLLQVYIFMCPNCNGNGNPEAVVSTVVNNIKGKPYGTSLALSARVSPIGRCRSESVAADWFAVARCRNDLVRH
jgi:hypothetical protein